MKVATFPSTTSTLMRLVLLPGENSSAFSRAAATVRQKVDSGLFDEIAENLLKREEQKAFVFPRHDANVSAAGVWRERSVSCMDESAANSSFSFPSQSMKTRSIIQAFQIKISVSTTMFHASLVTPIAFAPPPPLTATHALSTHSFNLSPPSPTSFCFDNWYTSLRPFPPTSPPPPLPPSISRTRQYAC